MQCYLLEEALVDGLLQAVGVNHFWQHLAPHVGRASVVVAGHYARARSIQAGSQNVDGSAQASVRFLGPDAHVLGQRLAEGVVGLVHVDAELFQTTQLLEALVGGQFAFFLWLVKVVEVGGVGINAVGSQGFAARGEQLGSRRFFLMLALEDDLLRVRDDNVEPRAIQRVQRGTSLFEIMETQMGSQEIDVLRWHHAHQVEGLDFLERLQHRLIRCEHQCVVAIVRILRKFVGQQELIEDAGSHQNSFAGAHR
ncbi:hypothetical protein SDC9_104491 [bioreactor metagenome]|uniref:Uncharacterized protein n=1 Tax=bioreactor metagenome TaxID=1076179 RepID=A0A645AY33_9ZZZZ